MSTREIILLRHAQANDTTLTGDDHERDLTAHGQVQADSAGDWLKSHAATIDCVLSSTALRAQQTRERILAVIDAHELHEDARIYNATPGDLLEVLNDHSDDKRVLLIGHNPGLERLVALLVTGQSGDYRGIAPAGVAWLELPENAPLEPGSARLKHFWSPP